MTVPSHNQLRTDVIFTILFGIVATTVGYQFGFGNQTEQIPIVMRFLDPSFIQHDFYVNSAAEFGPRYYYVSLLAHVTKLIPLPVVIAGLALIVNMSLCAITIFASRDLLHSDTNASYLAAVLVVSVSSFSLGLVTDIRFVDFQPASLAIPGCLLAIWAGIRGKPVLAALLAGISSLSHPLYGVETGAIAIGTAFLSLVIQHSRPVNLRTLQAVVFRCAAASVLLAVAAFVFWINPQITHAQAPVPDREIIDILAYFRAPHHYIPSQFPISHYIAFTCFLVAYIAALSTWYRDHRDTARAISVLIPTVIVIFSCAAGFLLLEVWPTRLGMVAQPFRLLYIPKWIGLMVLSWLFAGWMVKGGWKSVYGWIASLSGGSAHALMSFLSIAAEKLDRMTRGWAKGMLRPLGPMLLLVVAVWTTASYGKPNESVLVAVGIVTGSLLLSKRKRSWKVLSSICLVVVLVVVAGINRSVRFVDWDFLSPRLTWEDHAGDDIDIARWVRVNTPDAAVFVIPAEMSSFRIVAERAVVVDFKSLPFGDSAMQEWRQRIRDCYGNVDSGGFEARSDMAINYRSIDDTALVKIAAKYGARFAVLYVETPTSRPVLFGNSQYKIVQLHSSIGSS